MAKWKIDRVINILSNKNESNKSKVLHFIKCLRDNKINEITSETVGSLWEVSRRGNTFLINHGLMKNNKDKDLSEIALEMVRHPNFYEEFITLQVITKYFEFNDEVISPFSIITKILNNEDVSYLTANEFSHFILNITSTTEVDTAIKQIINDREQNVIHEIDKNSHIDIWTNLYIGCGIIEKSPLNDNAYVLTKKYADSRLRKEIEVYFDSIKNKDIKWFESEYLAAKKELLKYLQPSIKYVDNKNKIVSPYNEKFIYTVLREYLFNEKTSLRIIEEKFIGNENLKLDTKGLIAKTLLNSFNIDTSKEAANLGIYSGYNDWIGIILIKLLNSTQIDDVVIASKMLKYNENSVRDVEDYIGNELIEMENPKFEEFVQTGENFTFFGIPGTGKSYRIKQIIKEKNMLSVYTMFHPSYQYSNFVGSLRPVYKNDRLEYKFNPGPFTKALELALNNPSKSVVLVIEEMNRGNTLEIFGDIFQLLDRKDDHSSEYSVSIPEIQDYFQNELSIQLDTITIPSNLSIYSTMNTSDQGTFTLDNATKRRWKKEYISSKSFSEDLKKMYVPGSNSLWIDFLEKTNRKIVKLGLSDDFQIGAYFLEQKYLSEAPFDFNFDKINVFINNIFEYLWNNIHMRGYTLFIDSIHSFEEIHELIYGVYTNLDFDLLNIINDEYEI